MNSPNFKTKIGKNTIVYAKDWHPWLETEVHPVNQLVLSLENDVSF